MIFFSRDWRLTSLYMFWELSSQLSGEDVLLSSDSLRGYHFYRVSLYIKVWPTLASRWVLWSSVCVSFRTVTSVASVRVSTQAGKCTHRSLAFVLIYMKENLDVKRVPKKCILFKWNVLSVKNILLFLLTYKYTSQLQLFKNRLTRIRQGNCKVFFYCLIVHALASSRVETKSRKLQNSVRPVTNNLT